MRHLSKAAQSRIGAHIASYNQGADEAIDTHYTAALHFYETGALPTERELALLSRIFRHMPSILLREILEHRSEQLRHRMETTPAWCVAVFGDGSVSASSHPNRHAARAAMPAFRASILKAQDRAGLSHPTFFRAAHTPHEG